MQHGLLSRIIVPAGLIARGSAMAWHKPLRITGFFATPQELVRGSPEIARALYRGTWSFAGHTVKTGTTCVFDLAVPDVAWAEALHGFGWLSHLAAQGGGIDRVFARTLTDGWQTRRQPRIARRSSVRANRVLMLLRHGPFLLEGASAGFSTRFCRSLANDVAALSRVMRARNGLVPAIAVAKAAHCLEGAEGLNAEAMAALAHHVQRQILPDGMPVSRSPRRLLDLLQVLIPLRQLMEARRSPIPQDINGAIERMIAMLRFFTLGDGGLAHFQGAGIVNAGEVKAVLDQDYVLGRPLTVARYGQYVRLAQGSMQAIMDCGIKGDCAGTFAFEFSDGPHRVVTNCGWMHTATAPWNSCLAGPSAHSTLDCGQDRPHSVSDCDWQKSESGALAGAMQTFARTQHRRDLFLSADGRDMRGEDVICTPDGTPAPHIALRFHLHPAVKATRAQNGSRILLQLSDRSAWQFSARGGTLSLEESVYHGQATGVRRTMQIVLRCPPTRSATLQWAFRRIERRDRALKAGPAAPRLPF